MSAPSRFTSGLTQAASFQPLGHVGIPDPFFYAYYEDDFIPYNAALYTVTAAGGTVAGTGSNGAGGRILFTTGAIAGNSAAIQVVGTSMQYVATKKLAFLTRYQTASGVTSTLIAGLINTTAAPFTLANITDGIYFNSAAGSADLTVIVRSASATIGSVTITGALPSGSDIDLGFLVDRKGNINIYIGNNLEGAQRQDFAVAGIVASIPNSTLTAPLSTVLTTPTLAMSNGATAAAMTGVADFMFAGMER